MDPMRAEHLLNLGVDLVGQGRYVEARPPLQEAIALYQPLEGQDPTYRDRLATAFANLGISLVPLHQFGALIENLDSLEQAEQLVTVFDSLPTSELEEALNAEQSALPLYRTLATDDAYTYRPKVARCLSLMGIILMPLRRDAEAMAALNEAITLYEACVVDDSSCVPLRDGARQFLVVAAQLSLFRNAGALGVAASPRVGNRLVTRIDKLIESFEILAVIIENLRPHAASDSEIQRLLAEALLMHGHMRRKQDRYEDALEALEEAEKIYQSVANEDQTYAPKLVLIQSEVSQVLAGLERRREALDAARDVIDQCRALKRHCQYVATIDSVDREGCALLVLSLHGAGQTLGELSFHEEALDPISDAAALARSLAAEDDRYREHLKVALFALSITLHWLGRETEMRHVLEEANQRGIPIFSEQLPD